MPRSIQQPVRCKPQEVRRRRTFGNWVCGALRISCFGLLLMSLTGCGLVPKMVHEPVFYNPYPQLARVAVAPFFNLSTEPAADGRQFALAYFEQLQSVRGFEVVPVGVVEQAMAAHHLSLSSPNDARTLAQILNVDAIVVGAITDYSAYEPPRCGLRVEWYAANPLLHPIPVGYGLPLGTPEEADIPAKLRYEAAMAEARGRLAALTPAYEPSPVPPVVEEPPVPPPADPYGQILERRVPPTVVHAAATTVFTPPETIGAVGTAGSGQACLLPGVEGAEPTLEPVMRHTRVFQSTDPDFASALREYFASRAETRYGDWQSYLLRSDDFVRFCMHLHIAEMLTARGGAGESEVVWRWPDNR